MAFQSVLLLMVLRRTSDLKAAGIFTIANADSNLFLTIGKFGMKNFQVSDTREQFTFGEYRCFRWMTTAAMIAVSGVFVLISAYQNGYSANKALIIFWMCLYKAADSIEDVYYAQYQRRGRLDVGAKAVMLRISAAVFIFAVLLIITKNLLLSLVLTTILSWLTAWVFVRMTAGAFIHSSSLSVDSRNLRKLFGCCLPLFLGAFLAFYIGNAPKYSIDAILSDELQACYGFIAMPVFVIGLLNNFIFSPLMVKMSLLWNDKKRSDFLKRTMLQAVIVGIITLLCIGGAWLIGIPVLNWLYHTDLSVYKKELLVMLLGGGFLALSGLLGMVLTIMRRQRMMLLGYVTTSALALLFSDRVVRAYGVMGASVFYTALMIVLCLVFAMIFAEGIKRAGN